MPEEIDKAFWDQHYQDHAGHPHGHEDGHGGHGHEPGDVQPGSVLVTEVSGLAPGTALDAGCGQGRDAIWLAGQGWRVTAVDFATAALDRARAHAEAAGADLASRIDWVEADLGSWTPGEQRFDLVLSQYAHLPAAPRAAMFRRLAEAVAPGGTLLIAGHHASDLETTVSRGSAADLYLGVEEVVTALDPDRWDIAVAEARPRTEHDRDGHPITVHDAVVRARKRS